jgi:hypothetical protein
MCVHAPVAQGGTGREWSVMLCRERRIEWDREALVQHLKLVSNEQVRAFS